MREIAKEKKILALRVEGASVEEIAQNTGASIEEVVIPTILPTEIRSSIDIYTSGKDIKELNISTDC